MPIVLRRRQDMSINQLLALRKQGIDCTKTPHCGNFYPNNLAFTALGFRMLCVDHTVGEKDINFHPHCIIRDGQRDVVAHKHLLTTHARVSRRSTLVSDGRFQVGARVVDEHMNTLARVFPDAWIERFSHVLRAQQDLLTPLFQEATSALGGRNIWWRYAYHDGHIGEYRRNEKSWSYVSREPIFGLTNDHEGWIPPNELNILSDVIRGALHNGSEEVYHLSGPDMHRYIQGMLQELSKMYDRVRARVLPQLPSRITLNLPAVHEMRFAVRADRQERLDELLDAYFAFRSSARSGLGRLREAIRSCPDVFYDIKDGDFLSQHDLIDGEHVHALYIHPAAYDMSFAHCEGVMHELRAHRAGGSRSVMRDSHTHPFF